MKKTPNSSRPASPTQRVGGGIGGDFPPVKHLAPMLSLDNAYTEEDLLNFDATVKKLCAIGAESNVVYSVEPKFDGGSIALVYDQNNLRCYTGTENSRGYHIECNIAVCTIACKF